MAMSGKPASAMIGLSVMAGGILLAVAAYKNAALLGRGGILVQAVTTGHIDPSKAPPLTGTKVVWHDAPGTKTGPNLQNPGGALGTVSV